MTQPNQVAAASVDTQPSDNELAIGTITSLNPLTVDRGGGPVNQPGVLDSARAVPLEVGDVVAMIREKGTWLILGKNSANTDAQFPLMQAGEASITFVALTSFTQSVSFATAFSSAPAVSCNISSGSGTTAQWHVRAISITAIGFVIFAFTAGAAGSWTGVPVGWQAQARTQ